MCFNPGFFNPIKVDEYYQRDELESRMTSTIKELGYVDGEISLRRVISEPYVTLSIDTGTPIFNIAKMFYIKC